jgi:predicted nucleic acid-binding protein
VGQQYLTDSNAVIDYLAGKLSEKGMTFMNQVVNAIPNISVITKIEVLVYKIMPESYTLLKDFVTDSVVLGLTDEVVEKTIEIRKANKIKTPDAIIAATAAVNQLLLITRNTKDFLNIEGVGLINPNDL